MGKIKYWILILLFSLIPSIGLHYLVRPMWFAETNHSTGATSLELLFTVLILPVYLNVIHNYLIKKHSQFNTLLINGIIIIGCILISQKLHFMNWADSTGNGESPDYGTVEVMKFERIVGIGVSLIGVFLIYLNQRKSV